MVTLLPRFGPSLFVITVCGPLALEELVFFFGTDGPKPLVDGAVVLGSTRSVVEALALVPVPVVVPSPFASVLPTVILFVTRSFFDTLALHLNLTVQIAAIVVASVLQLHIVTIAADLALLINYFLRLAISRKAMMAAREDIGAWKIPFLEALMMWRNLFLRIKHSRSDKYDFIRR